MSGESTISHDGGDAPLREVIFAGVCWTARPISAAVSRRAATRRPTLLLLRLMGGISVGLHSCKADVAGHLVGLGGLLSVLLHEFRFSDDALPG